MIEDAELYIDALAELSAGEFEAVRTSLAVSAAVLDGSQLERATQLFHRAKRDKKLHDLRERIVHYYAAAFER